MNIKKISVVFLLSIITVSGECITIKKNKPVEVQFSKPNEAYLINKRIDLNSSTITLPPNCVLKFRRGGCLINGTVVGLNTKIIYRSPIFKDIKILGSWNVPVISSSMFQDFDGNVLGQLMNLQNDTVKNVVLVESGKTLNVKINENRRSAIRLLSNTELILNDTLKLESQRDSRLQNGYYVVDIRDKEDVWIHGEGEIVGDRKESLLDTEYGHGICIWGSNNVKIEDVSISDCNGDCIAVSLGNKNVSLNGLTLSGYHRNGISVVDCDRFSMSNSIVRNGGSTDPYAGIDIEPNNGCSVDSAFVDNIQLANCAVGLSSYCSGNIGFVKFNNITISESSRCPVSISGIRALELKDIRITNTDVSSASSLVQVISCEDVIIDRMTVFEPDNQLKYPFYLNNKHLVVENSVFVSPQLFSYHLKDAQFNNCKFSYDSFVWTSSKLNSSNIAFKNCIFNGPVVMYPKDVSFIKCTFDIRDCKTTNSIHFYKSQQFTDKDSGVYIEDCKIKGKSPKESRIQNEVPNSVGLNTIVWEHEEQ